MQFTREEASYAAYPNNFEQSTRRTRLSGFSPSDAITATRSTESVYADVELNVTKNGYWIWPFGLNTIRILVL
jgi:hypothetical protein